MHNVKYYFAYITWEYYAHATSRVYARNAIFQKPNKNEAFINEMLLSIFFLTLFLESNS